MDLCSPIRIETINGKKYIMVIVDDYSRYTRTLFIRSKDETPEVLKDFLKMIQRKLQAQAEAIATVCYTQNRYLIIPRHEKTPYQSSMKGNLALKHLNILATLVTYLELRIQDHDNEPSSATPILNVSLPADKTESSPQKLNLLFSPLFEEYFTAGTLSVSKSFNPSNNLQQQDTQPTLNVQPTTKPINTPKNVNAEKNNNDQVEDAKFEAYEFINPFAPSGPKAAESSPRNIDTSNMHTFYQRQPSEYHWTKDHPS
ncbi:retrovirus-related pol polyprotein from transposon TNT 1-94 [Tanacetum coccineum]